MSNITQKIECINGFITDIKSGRAIDHQPTRKNNSKWYLNHPDTILRIKNSGADIGWRD